MKNLLASDLLEATGLCPVCGRFPIVEMRSCTECGEECPVLSDCVGLIVYCSNCESINNEIRQDNIGDAINDWKKRTKKHRVSEQYWQCSGCKYQGEGDCCTVVSDFKTPQWKLVDTPDGEWKSEWKCALFEGK